ncbi:MAG: NAD-dependent epimerase/dehydratase family protein [Methanomassiliicoccaceae archaeon]|jgi:UDP-glucuronate decarboxylase|nr:NAD-dependent epimerase/dehydratase family protein [Methanomassiliicoccaceae archaeon]
MRDKQLKLDLEHTYRMLSDEERARLCGKSILITGCAGFLGFYFMHFFSHFRKELDLKNVICLDNFMLGRPDWMERFSDDKLFIIKKFDIIKDKIEDIQEAAGTNHIIHMASIASPTFYRKYPIETLDANIWGLRNLLDFYSSKKVDGFMFFSSSEIYGDPVPEAVPTSEEYNGNVSATGPRACYDESKRFGETMCMLFAEKYGMPIAVVRPFNNYGPGMRLDDKRVPADFMKNVVEGKDIVILSSGSPTRTFCYIADSVAGYLKALVHGKYDYFNIGIESPEISIMELAQIYKEAGKEVFGYKGAVRYESSKDPQYLAHNPQRRCPNIKKAREVIGYDPSISVREGVIRFMRYVKDTLQ